MTSLSSSRFMPPSFAIAALLFAAFLGVGASSAAAQTETSASSPATSSLQQRIHDQLAALQQPSGSDRDIASQWARLGAEYLEAADFTNSENAYSHAIQLLRKNPADASLYAEALDQLGALYRIYDRLPEALNCRRTALALRQQLGDPLPIARSQGHLAELDLLARRYKEAFAGSDAAYQTMTRLGDKDKAELLSTLIVRTYAQCGLHRRSACLADAKEALALSRSAFASESQPVAAALVALGSAQLKNGSAAEAESSTEQALEIFKTQLAPSDPRMIFAMQQDRDCLRALHRDEEAHDIGTQLTTMSRQAGRPCPTCTVSVYGLRAPTQ
jgi:tetratricopeptide (TPR) repeat protein